MCCYHSRAAGCAEAERQQIISQLLDTLHELCDVGFSCAEWRTLVDASLKILHSIVQSLQMHTARCSITIKQRTTETLCFICLKRYTLIQLLLSVWVEYLLLCRHTWWEWRVPTRPRRDAGPASYKMTKEKRKAPVSLTLLHCNSEETLKQGSLDQEFEQGIKS